MIGFWLKYVKKGDQIAWNDSHTGNFENLYTVEEVLGHIKKIKQGEYIDVHGWVFTPESFLALIENLAQLNFIKLEVLNFFGTEGFEFFVTLIKRESE